MRSIEKIRVIYQMKVVNHKIFKRNKMRLINEANNFYFKPEFTYPYVSYYILTVNFYEKHKLNK